MIKVLVVDDSAVVRQVLTEELSKFEDIDVVGSAIDPYMAREKIIQLKPDVITLDIEMPRMDGLSFLRKLMKHHPLPVVVVSSLTPQNSETAVKALALGAVEIVSKPGSQFSVPDVAKSLVRAVRAAASANVTKRDSSPDQSKSAIMSLNANFSLTTTHKVVAIGASTGGTIAIENVLRGFPANCPGIVIVQHMPEFFTASFAERLNKISAMEVREAKEGDYITPGLVLIAPGNYHMLVGKSGARYYVRLKQGPAVHHQRPSVDVLFQSVAKNVGQNAIGVILTGMGADGAKGMLEMHDAGAYTIAQDEKSCIVFGMPKEAIKMGGVDKIVSLENVASNVLQQVEKVSV
ncbi:chemotaxis response regulator protein-glutamate methylesterase [candidate division KSB1 bacterium]|nr:chemotaxis response regulator protein-glutamate methylesterase [candidate division KSB1 bacterium]